MQPIYNIKLVDNLTKLHEISSIQPHCITVPLIVLHLAHTEQAHSKSSVHCDSLLHKQHAVLHPSVHLTSQLLRCVFTNHTSPAT